MIRDTSSQDAVISAPPSAARKRRMVLIGGTVAAAALMVALFSAWRGSEASVSGARLRIAEVTRGTLVRDASVNGRIVAAVSPTLYSTAPATVTLPVAAGDTVKVRWATADACIYTEWADGDLNKAAGAH